MKVHKYLLLTLRPAAGLATLVIILWPAYAQRGSEPNTPRRPG